VGIISIIVCYRPLLLIPGLIGFDVKLEVDLRFFKRYIIYWHRTNDRKFPWRRSRVTQYQKIIAELLLQRTKAETVASFYPRFINRFPNWKTLAAASEHEIQEIIKPIGLWKRRSTSLKKLAIVMHERNGRFPKIREDIDKLPGVGQYIANSIELLCHKKAMPLLDVNMARVLERFFGPRKLADIRYDPYLQELAYKVVETKEPIKMNWAILDFAALVCKSRKPLCSDCPIASHCKYYIQNMRIKGVGDK